jgi:oligoendopeptidase F
VFRRAAHTLSDSEGKAAGRRRAAGRQSVEPLQHLLERRFPVPDGGVERRQEREARSGLVQRAARAADPGGSRKGDVGLFQSARRLQPNVRHLDERRSVEGAFYSKARKYSSALESQLDGPNIPLSVYSRLVDGVNRNLPAFHRYLKLRKQMMELDQLHYYDLYAPLVASVDLKYTPDEAQKLVLAAVAPLGTDTRRRSRAFDSRWIDLLPNEASARAPISTAAPTTSIRTC